VADVLIATTGHDVADARLHRLCGALVDAGLSVALQGLGDAGVGPPRVDVTAVPRADALRRLARACAVAVRGHRHRVLVVVDPELALPGLLWRRLRGGRLVVDVHEDYRAVLSDRAWAKGARRRAGRLLISASTWAAARADLTVVADDHVPPRRARHRLVIRNLPRPNDLPPPSCPDHTPRAIYVGDVRRSRGLHRMVDAVLAAPPWELDLVGPVAHADDAWLAWRLAVAGSGRRRIRVHGRLAPARAWSLAHGAWVGLALLEDTPAFRAALPTKLYEYLGSGLAVLASPLPRVADLLGRSGAGLLADGTEQAAHCLQRWVEEPALLAAHRAAAGRWARDQLCGVDSFAALAKATADLLKEAN
jgi:glycosyltransferase involved in cell wall biosynthesis